MRYYIIAGEHSGDMHGADLINEIKKIDHQADFWASGGKAMSKAIGGTSGASLLNTAYMGIDFLKKSYFLWRFLKFCKRSLIHYKPDVVILIDYSGFNMHLAAFASRNGFKVHYYIPPKIWAHGPTRITKIKRDVARVYSILPFEVAHYQIKSYYSIDYVGNPLVHKVDTHLLNTSFISANRLDNRPIIALLPGSRIDEIRRLLPFMVDQAIHLEGYQLVVAGLTHIPFKWYQKLCPSTIAVVYDQTYDLMAFAKVGIIASGTASLEAALLNLPQIVVYKLDPFAHWFYKRVAMIKYISLVNILLNQPIVPELIQYELTSQNLSVTLRRLLEDGASLQQAAAYKEIRRLLGNENSAQVTAQHIVTAIQAAAFTL